MKQLKKYEVFSSKEDLAVFLRELADALENGGHEQFPEVGDFEKLKIVANNEFGRINLKAKFTPAKSRDVVVCEECGAEALLPDYKELKGRMKRSFRLIFSMASKGELPPEEAVESFLADSESMVSYPGYGDEFYDEYTALCNDFAALYKSGNTDGLAEAVKALAICKNRCHAIYD